MDSNLSNRETEPEKICKQWYDIYKEDERNPRTNRKIMPDKRVWNSLEKECQPLLRKINKRVLTTSKQGVNDEDLREVLIYPEIDNLKQDIQDIVDENWDNPKLKYRCTYNSENSDKIPDLFTVQDIKNSLKNPRSSLLSVETPQNKKSGGIPVIDDIKDLDYDIGEFGATDAKKPLMDIATEFNTVNFIGNMETRLLFIGLITICFTEFSRVIHGKVPNLNESNYNVMFKGGTTVRFLIKELVRDFTRDIENHILDKISSSIKLSDYDFEMMCNPDYIEEADMIKLNVLSYIVILRIKKYLEKHKSYYFNFFQLRDEIKAQKLEQMRTKMNKEIKNFKKTITTIRGTTITNFYKDITVDYIELDNKDCKKGTGPIINSGGPDQGMPNFSKYKTNQWYEWMNNKDKEPSNIREPDSNNCRTDFALVFDGSEYYDDKGVQKGKILPEVTVSFITAKNLFKKYGISKKSCSYYTTSKEEGSQFYATHNPLINNPKNDMKFQLNRIKYSYTIYFTKKIGGVTRYYRDFIPGEILDLSCAFTTDRKSFKFKGPFNENKYVQKFKFVNYKLDFYSYSILGHLGDMESMIFVEPYFKPWNSHKYEKRIVRLLYLTILYLFTDTNSIDSGNRVLTYNKKVKYLKKLQEMVDDNFSRHRRFRIEVLETLRKNLWECSQFKNSDATEYAGFKKFVSVEIGELIEVMQAEYNLTRNQELHVGPIESGVLSINQPSIYGF